MVKHDLPALDENAFIRYDRDLGCCLLRRLRTGGRALNNILELTPSRRELRRHRKQPSGTSQAHEMGGPSGGRPVGWGRHQPGLLPLPGKQPCQFVRFRCPGFGHIVPLRTPRFRARPTWNTALPSPAGILFSCAPRNPGRSFNHSICAFLLAEVQNRLLQGQISPRIYLTPSSLSQTEKVQINRTSSLGSRA